jgi:hypothetical protein
MTSELRELACQVVAIPGWMWPNGMRTIDHFRIVAVDKTRGSMLFASETTGHLSQWWPCSSAFPDLTDTATGGLLYQMLGDDIRWVSRDAAGWICKCDMGPWTSASCLGEACARVAVSVGRWDGGVPHDP